MSWKFTLGARMALPVLLMALGLIILAGVALTRQHQSMLEERETLIKDQVNAALSILEGYYARIKQGEMSDEQAKKEATQVIRSISFGDNNYIFVNDRDARGVINRGAPQAEGKDFSQAKDARGFAHVRAMVERTQGGRSALIEYYWPRPGSQKEVRKLAYVTPFAPWGWIVGAGVYMDDLEGAMLSQTLALLGVGGLILALAGAASFVVVRSVSSPLRRMTAAMTQLAQGSLEVSIEGGERGDEIGAMGQALEVFRDNAQSNRRLQDEARAAEQRTLVERRQARVTLADTFDAQVGEILAGLSAAAEELDRTAQAMSDTAHMTQERTTEVNRALRDTSANVQAVASASEEMTASINEISSQVTRSTAVVGEAVALARETNTSVRALSDAAERIGQVVTLITDVASQTNLLALNATIEAARAGDAGKGFAVVAGEVKALANQTSKATDEIARQITDIQAQTGQSVQVLERITRAIAQVNDISASIAAAIEQQGAATHEISRAIQQASTGTHHVAHNAEGLQQAADISGTSAKDVRAAAGLLAHKANDLRGRVSGFVAELRRD
ncbi:Methyl-accepting chemotaxis sensory transducer [Pararhodospirillum photometricum DSM 122]|uniref:Methyl-accepting chemotaxis sensory transducer n=2 Tax=Pararhodospirillum photometricum TaxID=1084 RepID=H6SPH0_PARPM|nr:Methyl-accepting chemotaxis sensory transducer [Pararhodospirillum photometricum DSM 122]